MECGRWWYGDAAAAMSYGYAIGFAHAEYPIALVLSLVLEAGTMLISGNPGFPWTIVMVALAATIGAAGIPPGSRRLALSFFSEDKTNAAEFSKNAGAAGESPVRSQRRRLTTVDRAPVLMALLEIGAYLICRRMASETSFGGFPSGALYALCTLATFFLAGLGILSTGDGEGGDKKVANFRKQERIALFAALSIAVSVAHLSAVAAHLVIPWPATSTAGMPAGGFLGGFAAVLFLSALLPVVTWAAAPSISSLVPRA